MISDMHNQSVFSYCCLSGETTAKGISMENLYGDCVITSDTMVVNQNNHQHLCQEWRSQQRVHMKCCFLTTTSFQMQCVTKSFNFAERVGSDQSVNTLLSPFCFYFEAPNVYNLFSQHIVFRNLTSK